MVGLERLVLPRGRTKGRVRNAAVEHGPAAIGSGVPTASDDDEIFIVSVQLRPEPPMDEESMSRVCTWTVEEVTTYLARFYPNEAQAFNIQDVDGTSLMLLTRHGPPASAYLYRSQPSSQKRSQQACHLRGDTGPADYASWMLRASRWCLRHRRPHPQRGGLLLIAADGARRLPYPAYSDITGRGGSGPPEACVDGGSV